jgi:adenylate cyclase
MLGQKRLVCRACRSASHRDKIIIPKPENEQIWRALMTGDPPLPFHRQLAIFRILPSHPRCRMCGALFGSIGGIIMRLAGKRSSPRNPHFCNVCETFIRDTPGGEVEATLLFADLRGSTSLAEDMSPTEYKVRSDCFYAAATEALVEADA